MLHPPTPPPMTTTRACSVMAVDCSRARPRRSPRATPSDLRGARQQVVLADDVVLEVLAGDLLQLAAKGGEPRRIGLEHLDHAKRRRRMHLEERAEVRR